MHATDGITRAPKVRLVTCRDLHGYHHLARGLVRERGRAMSPIAKMCGGLVRICLSTGISGALAPARCNRSNLCTP
jgi:hypothetical protein